MLSLTLAASVMLEVIMVLTSLSSSDVMSPSAFVISTDVTFSSRRTVDTAKDAVLALHSDLKYMTSKQNWRSYQADWQTEQIPISQKTDTDAAQFGYFLPLNRIIHVNAITFI